MVTFLVLSVIAVLSLHVARRVREDAARASEQTRPTGEHSRLAGREASLDWRALVTPRRKEVGIRVGVAAVPGCVAVVAGGMLFGLWGLTAGTLVLAAGLVWAVALGGESHLRRPRSGGSLSERERRDFDEIVARLTGGE